MVDLICDKCGGGKQRSYKLWCPCCDKPQPATLIYLNWRKCLAHFHAIDPANIEVAERLQDKLDEGGVCTNGAIRLLWFDDTPDWDLFKKTFNLPEESAYFEFSW